MSQTGSSTIDDKFSGYSRALLASELAPESCADDVPFVVTPRGSDKSLNEEAIADLKASYNQHGRVLMRGFDVGTIECFEDLLTNLGFDLAAHYTGGASPRHLVSKKTFSSTEAPKHFILSYHNEMAYLNERPRHISFYCKQASPNYSETPIFDCASLLAKLPLSLQQKLEQKGVRYVRHFYTKPHRINVNKTWKEAFGVDAKQQLETILTATEFDYSWLTDELLQVNFNAPAVLVDPTTGNKVINIAALNQWTLHYSMERFKHRYSWWVRKVVDWYVIYQYTKKDVFFETRFGDGVSFTREETRLIQNASYDAATLFKWQNEDILLLDNIRYGHGRLNVEQPEIRMNAAALGDIYDIRQPLANGQVAAPIAV